MPWTLVVRGRNTDSAQGFGSVLVVGADVLTAVSEQALDGLLAHELAHIRLDHGRGTRSVVVVAGLGVWKALGALWQVTSAAPTPIAALVEAVLGVAGVLVLVVGFFLSLSGDNYPREVAADALVVKSGFARELAAMLRTAPDNSDMPWWGRALIATAFRTHPTIQQRLARLVSSTDKAMPDTTAASAEG